VSSQQTTDVLIIGAGVIGCASAYYLSKDGLKVTVLERGEIGSQASGAAAGLFSWLKPSARLDPYNRLLLTSHALFPSLISELQDATGIAIEYQQSGTLRTIQHPKRILRLQSWLAYCQHEGLSVTLLSEEQTRLLEPLLSPDICASLSFPTEGQVRAQSVVAALSQAAINNGSVFYTHTEVIAVHHHNQRVVSVTTATGETISCGHLIIAAGAWAASCGAWFDLDIPVRPQRGQVLSLHQPSPPIRHIIIGKGIYIAPKQDGSLVVGATNDDVGFDISNTAGGILALLDAAVALVPTLAQCAFVRAWAGLRPKTPDNYPIIGAAPGWHNLTLAVGHYSFGILLSAITAQAITELVATGETPEVVQPFSLGRFAPHSDAR
jgi:glycine oxidase